MGCTKYDTMRVLFVIQGVIGVLAFVFQVFGFNQFDAAWYNGHPFRKGTLTLPNPALPDQQQSSGTFIITYNISYTTAKVSSTYSQRLQPPMPLLGMAAQGFAGNDATCETWYQVEVMYATHVTVLPLTCILLVLLLARNCTHIKLNKALLACHLLELLALLLYAGCYSELLFGGCPLNQEKVNVVFNSSDNVGMTCGPPPHPRRCNLQDLVNLGMEIKSTTETTLLFVAFGLLGAVLILELPIYGLKQSVKQSQLQEQYERDREDRRERRRNRRMSREARQQARRIEEGSRSPTTPATPATAGGEGETGGAASASPANTRRGRSAPPPSGLDRQESTEMHVVPRMPSGDSPLADASPAGSPPPAARFATREAAFVDTDDSGSSDGECVAGIPLPDNGGAEEQAQLREWIEFREKQKRERDSQPQTIQDDVQEQRAPSSGGRGGPTVVFVERDVPRQQEVDAELQPGDVSVEVREDDNGRWTPTESGADSQPANNSNSPADRGEGEDAMCVVCMASKRAVLLLPCRHLCLCSACAETLLTSGRANGGSAECPVCRGPVEEKLDVFM